jgi:hypothetical protein
MENYGFVLMNREEATQFGFPNGGTGMFEGLYYDMMASISREPTNKYGTAPEMTEDEKFISFLNRYFVFRKVRHVAAEKITKLIEEKMPSVEASKCSNAAAMGAPVVYVSPEDADNREEDEQGINKIAKSFGKREQIATKEKEQEQEKLNANKLTASSHFIRPLGDAKITIRVYDPLVEENDASEPVEVTNLPIEETEPAIQLVPKTVRIGKTIKVPNPLRKKKT